MEREIFKEPKNPPLMSPQDLIKVIKSNYQQFIKYVSRLEKLADKYPDAIVALNVDGGECEADGIITPITENGEIDESIRIPIRRGDPMPEKPHIFLPK